jgi:hypothetical protein
VDCSDNQIETIQQHNNYTSSHGWSLDGCVNGNNSDITLMCGYVCGASFFQSGLLGFQFWVAPPFDAILSKKLKKNPNFFQFSVSVLLNGSKKGAFSVFFAHFRFSVFSFRLNGSIYSILRFQQHSILDSENA